MEHSSFRRLLAVALAAVGLVATERHAHAQG